jgi:hypothetical protein
MCRVSFQKNGQNLLVRTGRPGAAFETLKPVDGFGAVRANACDDLRVWPGHYEESADLLDADAAYNSSCLNRNRLSGNMPAEYASGGSPIEPAQPKRTWIFLPIALLSRTIISICPSLCRHSRARALDLRRHHTRPAKAGRTRRTLRICGISSDASALLRQKSDSRDVSCVTRYGRNIGARRGWPEFWLVPLPATISHA